MEPVMQPEDRERLDRLRSVYKEAVERWVAAIRAEEDLATPDHSTTAVDRWEQAAFREEDARGQAKAARAEYEDALRKGLYNF